ncbi:MAG: Gfo/Idh/MocA family oxidoreductase [Armatimonadetes bacterium]|nr:Gfo/Idh/MocA family oxidoreductase [Armatimonadota bacterium]
MKTIHLEPKEYQPQPPSKKEYGIGIIGCGGIVRGAHLPAYRQFGYRVVACCDIDPAAVQRAQSEYDIPFATQSAAKLAARPEVEIIDLAVHASQRRAVMEQIASAGKPILSQKPFALNYADARAMVDLCARHGVTLMINQQARWAPAHRAIKVLIERGILGHVYSVVLVNRSSQDHPGTWYVALKDFNIIDHGIHYLDLTRYFTGRTPLRVKATTTMVPGQAAVSPMTFIISLEYEPEANMMAAVHFNNIVQTRAAHRYEWFVDGTEGSLIGTQQELMVSFKDHPEHRQVFQIQGRWFPDAFGGSMGELMAAVAERREPATSGRDNLNSVKIAYAAVESAATSQAVELSAIG